MLGGDQGSAAQQIFEVESFDQALVKELNIKVIRYAPPFASTIWGTRNLASTVPYKSNGKMRAIKGKFKDVGAGEGPRPDGSLLSVTSKRDQVFTPEAKEG